MATIITVLIGILLHNGRLEDLSGYVRSIDARLTNIESKFDSRFASLDHKFDTRFDLLLSKVIDLDNRLHAN